MIGLTEESYLRAIFGGRKRGREEREEITVRGPNRSWVKTTPGFRLKPGADVPIGIKNQSARRGFRPTVQISLEPGASAAQSDSRLSY